MRGVSVWRCVAVCIFVAAEVALTFYWQQRYKIHIIFSALVLGTILAPSLYLSMIVASKLNGEYGYRIVLPESKIQTWTVRWSSFSMLLRHFCISITLGVAGIVVVACAMSATSAWCCIREGRQLQLCELATSVAKVFNRNGIDYHVSFGTLLGAVRDRDKREMGESSSRISSMIPWEHDFDIAIAKGHVGKAYKLLKEFGFNLERHSSVVAFRVLLPVASAWLSTWAETWIDVYPFSIDAKTGDLISPKKRSRNFFRKPLISEVKPCRNISICGFDSFSAPRLPIRYLRKQYGVNYLHPSFPPGYRNVTCHLFKDC